MKTNQKGFSVVEILIVVVVVGLLGAVGWLVYDRQNNKTDDRNTATTQTQTNRQSKLRSCNTTSEDQKSWLVASSHEDIFSMCVPGGWTLVSDTQSETFQVAPPFVVVNGKEAVIQNQEIGGTGGTRDMFQIFKAEKSYQGWTSNNAETSDFTLSDGTKGTRYYTKHTNVGEGIGPVEGEEDYEYLFEKNGKFVHAVYTIHPGTGKHLNTIEEVLKTLKIN